MPKNLGAATPVAMLSCWIRAALLVALFLSILFSAAAQAPARPLVVLNRVSRDVSLVDSATLSEIARLPVGYPPQLGAVSQDEQFAFVATERDPAAGISSIVKIQLSTGTIAATQLYATASNFVRLAVTPDGQRLLVIDRDRATLYVIRTSDLSILYTRQLCQSCDGLVAPLYSAPEVAVTQNSLVGHFAVPVDAALVSLNLATGGTIARHNIGMPGSSTAYSSLNFFDVAPSIPIATHPHFGVKAVEVGSGWSLALPLLPPAVTAAETLPLRFGAELLLIQGESTYDALPDSLRLYHVNSGGMLSYPSSETSFVPLFNPLTFEVWSVCRSVPSIQQCDPFRIDSTNLLNPSQSRTIVGPATSTSGIPRFSPDFRYYFYPMAPIGQLQVIDTVTKATLAPIAVGQSPIAIY